MNLMLRAALVLREQIVFCTARVRRRLMRLEEHLIL